jgi:hypothetical protein
MTEYRKCTHGNAGVPTATTPAPDHQSRGWEDLASEYDLLDMMDLENDASHVEPTVEEEFITYTTAPLSPKGTNIIKFWEVSNYNGLDYILISAIIIYRCKRRDCRHSMRLR